MTHAVVCGAGGFIGSHLVKRLKADEYWVRGVDVKKPEFGLTAADEFLLLELRAASAVCSRAGRGAVSQLQQRPDLLSRLASEDVTPRGHADHVRVDRTAMRKEGAVVEHGRRPASAVP
jgi:nucleoside-diphosphate-sugar epimerase